MIYVYLTPEFLGSHVVITSWCACFGFNYFKKGMRTTFMAWSILEKRFLKKTTSVLTDIPRILMLEIKSTMKPAFDVNRTRKAQIPLFLADLVSLSDHRPSPEILFRPSPNRVSYFLQITSLLNNKSTVDEWQSGIYWVRWIGEKVAWRLGATNSSLTEIFSKLLFSRLGVYLLYGVPISSTILNIRWEAFVSCCRTQRVQHYIVVSNCAY